MRNEDFLGIVWTRLYLTTARSRECPSLKEQAEKKNARPQDSTFVHYIDRTKRRKVNRFSMH
jgi:hypothetical protein